MKGMMLRHYLLQNGKAARPRTPAAYRVPRARFTALYLLLLGLCLQGRSQSATATTPAPEAGLQSEAFIRRYGALSNTAYAIRHNKQATVAFLGGSITNMKGWRNQVCEWLQQQYPDVRFRFLNAGIPSLGSLPHAFRLKRDVLDSGPVNLLFIEAAVNDHVNGTPAQTQRRALEGIVRHARAANPSMDIVLMAFADEDKMADYHAGKIPAEVALHNEIASRYRLPFINLAEEVTRRIDKGEFSWKEDFKDLHPSPFGQTLYFNSIRTLLEKELAAPAKHRIAGHVMPAAGDAYCYTQGDYVPVTAAVQLQGFTLRDPWQPHDSVHTRPGFVNIPVLEALAPGASLSLPFNGNAVGIAVLSGPDAGAIQYSIDDGPAKSADLFTEWSPGLHLPWYLLLGDGLAAGPHVLRITVSGQHHRQSKGAACRIAHFLVNK